MSLVLRKWYLDVVQADGSASIAYWLDVHWGPLTLRAASLLSAPVCAPAAPATSHTTLAAGPEPATDAQGLLRWAHDGLGVDAHWPATAPVARQLFSNPSGHVRWTCLCPGAPASMSSTRRGLGYAECLEMTLPPWSLPIAELAWGRAITPSASVVWIQWRGPSPLLLILASGDTHTAGEVTDTRVATASLTVDLTEPRTLRDGPLGSTALAPLPGLSRLAPIAWLASRETKWVSRARITSPVGTEQGWAIHEVVRFQGVA